MTEATHKHLYVWSYRAGLAVDVRCACGKTPLDELMEQPIVTGAHFVLDASGGITGWEWSEL